MMQLNILLTVVFLVLELWQCNGEDIQYAFKVVSDTKQDHFAVSLATAHQRLIVGAPPADYVLVEQDFKLRAPQGRYFGENLDVNEHFMVVSLRSPYSVHVFSSTHPYPLVARIPVDQYVLDVKIVNDNTIIVAIDDGHMLVYKYTHSSSWERLQKIDLKDYVHDPGSYISLAVSGDALVVGYWDGHRGRVKIYNKMSSEYIFTTTLDPPEPQLNYFGYSVAVEAQQLVATSSERITHNNILFTYEFHPSEGKWLMNGRFTVTRVYDTTIVSLQNNILAATVTDPDNNPEVCAYVYKLSDNSHPNNNNNNNKSVSNKTRFTWKKMATLKTNGVPTTEDRLNMAISVQDGRVFTGCVDFDDGYGTVFVHDLNKH